MYRIIVDSVIVVIIVTLNTYHPDSLLTLSPYFSPSIVGLFYLLNSSYFNSLFLTSVDGSLSLLDNYNNSFTNHEPVYNIRMDKLRPLVNDTYVKFSGLNKLNYLNFKDDILYDAKLNSLNNLLIKNVNSVIFYQQTIDHLAKVNLFYVYVIYLIERNISSMEVHFDEIDGTPLISYELSKDIVDFRLSLKNLFEDKEFSWQKNYS